MGTHRTLETLEVRFVSLEMIRDAVFRHIHVWKSDISRPPVQRQTKWLHPQRKIIGFYFDFVTLCLRK